MTALPDKQYRVVVNKGGKPLPYGQPGGGVFTDYAAAMARLDKLRRSSVDCDLYETACDWRLVSAPVVLEGQDQLPLE